MTCRERRVVGIFAGCSRALEGAEFQGLFALVLIQVRCFPLKGKAVRAMQPFLSFSLGSYER